MIPLKNAFGPIDADDLLDGEGNLTVAYAISNSVKDIISLKGSPRSLIRGRKGTGKTTLLHMIKSESGIKCILDIGADFPTVVEVLSKETRTKYTEPAARIWSTVIWNTIVLAVHKELREKFDFLEPKEKSILDEYVANLNCMIDNYSGTKVSEVTKSISERITLGSVGLAAAMVSAAFKNDLNIGVLIEIVESLLSKSGKTVSILIDTMEFYNIRKSQAASDCIRGLLHCCSTIHNDSKHIECRLFFPDELTHYVKTEISSSVLKDFRDTQLLHWTSSELVCLAALRLRDRIGYNSLSTWNLLALQSDNVSKAQEVFYKFLPPTVKNDRGDQCEVLSYILQHTQRTPRQFLIVLNRLSSSYFKTDGDIVYASDDKISITDIQLTVKKCAKEIYLDILSTYREIYPNLGKIIQRILPRLNSTFEDDELKLVFDETNISPDFQVDFEDMKSALSDVGAVGIVNNTKSNENVAYGNFSYMSGEMLLLSASDTYCIHPIFNAVHRPMEKQKFTVYPSGSSVFDN